MPHMLGDQASRGRLAGGMPSGGRRGPWCRSQRPRNAMQAHQGKVPHDQREQDDRYHRHVDGQVRAEVGRAEQVEEIRLENSMSSECMDTN